MSVRTYKTNNVGRRRDRAYAAGRIAALVLLLLTVADIVRVYLTAGVDVVVGMMLPRMGVMLGYTGSGAGAVFCTVFAYLIVIATALCVIASGRRYFPMMALLVLIAVDTVAALWLAIAGQAMGFVPSALFHAAALLCVSLAAAIGRYRFVYVDNRTV